MLGIFGHFSRAGMTTSERSLWTILTVSVSLMCAYSVKLDCQEMAACTDELRDMNQTINNRVGTSQMINTCIQLTQNYPLCFEPAKRACGLKFRDTVPYLLLYQSTKDSCNQICPIFQPLITCETKVSYVDLSTDKNTYCRSYIESMECLESTLENITCSFGEEAKAYILDNIYDQSARKFGDGVCMKARDCADIGGAMTSVTSCLRQWNSTRDYSDSGTDALKLCISKITTCSDALKMVPYFEQSLIGIDVTVPLTTEIPETSSADLTTTVSMTSSVRSPSSSTTVKNTPDPTRVATTSTTGREVTRTILSLSTSLKSDSVTGISTVVPATSEMTKTSTSLSKGAHSGNTNGGGTLLQSRATVWILVTLLIYFLT